MIQNIPGLLLWRKDLHSNYIDTNLNFSHFFGFKKPSEMIGINDYKLKTSAADLADIFQKCDKQVLESDKPKKFFEILYSANKKLRIIIVTKTRVTNQAAISETFGCAQDITDSYFKLGALLTNYPIREKKELQMHSFTFQRNSDKIHLTPRQEECLFFLLRYKTAKQIALILKISLRTTEDHIEQLKFKFQCQNKNELLEKALFLGYFSFIPQSLFNHQLSIALEE